MINLPSLENANVAGKRVFVRCDFDVPLSQQPASPAGGSTNNAQQTTIRDDTRLVSSISTIEYLLEQGAIVIAAGHLGRPKKQFTIDNLQLTNEEREFSLEPVAKWFAEEIPGLGLNGTNIGGLKAWRLKENFYILENLRFDSGEEENDSVFTHKLAYIADIYVNEAFGSSHRAHASIVGLPNLLPHFAGFHFQKEVKILNSVIENPKRPLTIIVGGAKIETKLPLISKMHKFADYVLVGGEIAEQDKILIKEQHEAKSLPAFRPRLQAEAGRQAMLLVADLNPEKSDITLVSLENFEQVISRSSCVVWNGPMGIVEIENSKKQIANSEDTSLSTKKLAEAILKSSAYKVVGGGDTIGFLNKHNLLGRFDFVSVGGGAMLEFLSGVSLPGIIALQD